MSDIQFMQRALQLAQSGRQFVSPNPMVGCVIVYQDKIIGEGFTSPYGGPHAEVNAINTVEDLSLLAESTLYVTLEPCAHFGKTPPCADLIVRHQLKKVVIACKDLFAKVDGKGIEKLRKGGVEVEVGLLEQEAKQLNERFFTFHEKKRPYVLLKWAQTQDGFLARENGDSKWISNTYARQLVHKWRTEEDAILVGKNTALQDNPSLTSRDWKGKNPIRILLDSHLQVPNEQTLFNNEASTLVFNTIRNDLQGTTKWIRLDTLNVDAILKKLYEENIQSVFVEGGAQVLNAFLESNAWDEARVFSSVTVSFGNGVQAPSIKKPIFSKEDVMDDTLTCYKN